MATANVSVMLQIRSPGENPSRPRIGDSVHSVADALTTIEEAHKWDILPSLTALSAFADKHTKDGVQILSDVGSFVVRMFVPPELQDELKKTPGIGAVMDVQGTQRPPMPLASGLVPGT